MEITAFRLQQPILSKESLNTSDESRESINISDDSLDQELSELYNRDSSGDEF